MSFNFKSIQVDATTAADIMSKVQYFIQAVEQVSSSAPGAAKLDAVKNATEQFIKSAYPSLAPAFATLWPEAAAVVNGIVALYNAIGFFKKLAGK